MLSWFFFFAKCIFFAQKTAIFGKNSNPVTRNLSSTYIRVQKKSKTNWKPL